MSRRKYSIHKYFFFSCLNYTTKFDRQQPPIKTPTWKLIKIKCTPIRDVKSIKPSKRNSCVRVFNSPEKMQVCNGTYPQLWL